MVVIVSLFSDRHEKLLRTGVELITDYWQTFLFSCLLFLLTMISVIVLVTIFTLVTSEAVGGVAFVIGIGLLVLFLPPLMVAGGVLLAVADRSDQDKFNWLNEVIRGYPTIFLTTLAVFIGAVLLLVVFGSIARFGSLFALQYLMPSLPNSVFIWFPGMVFSYLFLIGSIVTGMIGILWTLSATVTLPVQRLVIEDSWSSIFRRETGKVYQRISDFFLWVIALVLGLLLLGLFQSEQFVWIIVLFYYWFYVTAFVTEARSYRKDPESDDTGDENE
jgi:MFS family permease